MATPDPFLIEDAPAPTTRNVQEASAVPAIPATPDPFTIAPEQQTDPFLIAPAQSDPFAIDSQILYDGLLAQGDNPQQDRLPKNLITTGIDAVTSGTYGLSSSLYRFPETLGRAADFLTGLPGIKDINELLGLHDLGAELGINVEGTFAEAIQRGVEIGGEVYGPTQSAERLSKRRAQLFGEVDHYSEVADEAFDQALEGNFEPLGQVLTDPRAVVSFIGQAVPSLAMMLATGGNLGAIAIMEGMEVSADAAEFEAHTGMKVDPNQFMAALAQVTSLNTVAEKFGLNKILGSRGILGVLNAGVSEMSTEAFQAFNTNLSIWAQYNREKSLTGGILPGAIGGLGAGTAGGTAMSIRGSGAESSAEFNRDLQKEFEALMQQGDVELAKKLLPEIISTIEKRLEAAADEDVDSVLDLEAEGLTGDLSVGVTGATEPLSAITTAGRAGGSDANTAKWWATTKVVDPETGEIQLAIDHDFGTAPVVATQETFYNAKIKDLEAVIAAQEADILEADLAGNTEAVLQGQLLQEDYNQTLDKLQTQRNQEIDYSNKAVPLLTEWLEALMPGTKLVFSTNHAGESMDTIIGKHTNLNIKNSTHAAGHHWSLTDGTSIIELDLDNKINEDGLVNEATWVEDLIHEFGHSLFGQVYNAQSRTTQKALKNAWLKDLKQLLNSKTVEEYQRRRFAAHKAEGFTYQDEDGSPVPWIPGEDVVSSRKPNQFGMNEWVANQLAKSAQTNEVIQGPVGKFFKELIGKLKEFFNLTEGKYSATDTFQDFINLLAAKTALGNLDGLQGADTMTQQEAGQRAMAVINNVSKELGLVAPKLPPDVRFPHESRNMNGAVDRFGFFTRTSMGIFQVQDRNPHITGLRKFTDNLVRWWNDKMKFIARADDRLHTWRDLGDKRAAAVGAFQQELTVLSYEEGKKYGPGDEKFDKLVRKHGLDQEQLDMAAAIDGDMTAVLDELYAVLLADINKMTDVLDRQVQLDKLNKDFEALRNRNFFPLSRFGEYYMRVKAKTDMTYQGKEYKEGDVITFEMFEGGALFTNFSMDTPSALKKREKPFRNNALFEVASGVVNDTMREFSGLPPQLLSMMRDKLDLTETQKKELDNLLRDIAPGRSFTKHMKTRKNVAGYNSDSLRAYADYFMHFGNYVARIKYKGALLDNIGEVKASEKIIASTGDNAVKRGRIAQRMEADYNYAMNPDNEWANLRAIGFLWYLGFVPKSAYINLTQVPFVTYSHLAARYGDGAAMKQLMKSTKDTFGAYKNRKLRPDQNRLIDYLIETGVIEESMATEIAAVAEGRALSRTATNTLFGSQKAGSMIRQFAGYGSWMFQTAEKFNRRITALAAYEMAVKKGVPIRTQKGKLTGKFRKVSEAEAFRFAHQAVVSTQFEYARFNRPLFMRGKKSNLFLFYNYLQNMLYFVGNDPGASRYILLMLLAAGLSGLPFAEDAMDIFDFTAKKLNKATGDETLLPINIRKELRTYAAQIGADPDLVMHGASRYGFGLPALAEMVGLPMSNWDVHGSVSMGNLIPGIQPLTRSDNQMSSSLGRAAEEAGGAVLNIPLQLIYAIGDNNPDTIRRFERALPTIGQHISKALRYTLRGEATTPEGAVIKDFHVPEDKKDLAAILFQAAGFADTDVNRAQEEHYMKKDMIAYYELRKRMYLEELAYAHRTDMKQFHIIMADVRRYNKQLSRMGLGQMVVGPATIRRSITERTKKRKFIELGMPVGKKGVQVGREVEEGFTEELRQ